MFCKLKFSLNILFNFIEKQKKIFFIINLLIDSLAVHHVIKLLRPQFMDVRVKLESLSLAGLYNPVACAKKVYDCNLRS